MQYIVKRDNRKEQFNPAKIANAIQKALNEVKSSADVYNIVSKILPELKDGVTVEEIQDLVEKHLLKAGELEAARAYIRYRDQRTNAREAKSDLFKQFDLIVNADSADAEFKRENANINADAPMGVMLKFGSESAKEYNISHLINPKVAELHNKGDIHIHDLDFYHTFNCVTPDTKIVIKTDGSEHVVSLGDHFKLLGKGSHKISDTKILSKSGYVDLLYVHVREHDGLVHEFKTKHRSITCTPEHVLPIIRDGKELELQAKEIRQNDYLIPVHNRFSWEDVNANDDGLIISVRTERYSGKVYDLTTEDHYFIANNLVSHNCCQIPLGKLLESGFSTGHGHIRQPQSISSAAAVACIALQSNQNDMFGGQSFPMWDYDLAPYVARSFIKKCKEVANILGVELPDDFKQKCLDYYNKTHTLIESNDFLSSLGVNDQIYKKAYSLTLDECHQAMQSVIHNLNTMNCRSGAQTPFSSINYGTDTTPEGRMVSRCTLEETDKGLGYGETPIFPVQVFKCKHDVNLDNNSPNHDLFKLACQTSAKRLFPNFSFLDSPYNAMYYKENHPETEMAVMGCARGTETIVYWYKDAIYKRTFKEAWDHLSSLGFKTITTPKSVYIKLKDVKILDRNMFVVCKGILKNFSVNNWLQIEVEDKTLTVTTDHPLRVNDDRVEARNIKTNDIVYINGEKFQVTKVKQIDLVEDSFDVETVSDRFDLSGFDSHNCRTRVLQNDYSPENTVTPGRGNFSFCTINLPAIALEAKGNLDDFFKRYDEMIDACIKCLKDRFEHIAKKHPRNFPFLMQQGVYLGSDDLMDTDTVESALKHSSLSVGFIGLAECLTVLTGKHHGESEESQTLGLEIVQHLRDRMDDETNKTHLNWSCFATPAEGLCSRAAKLNKKRFGNIPGVTDRDFVTNSFHIPVWHQISAFNKMKLEAPYHALCNAGSISYVEVDGDLTKNTSAIEALVQAASKLNMNYFSVNHPVDRCPVCGYTGVIHDECPRCHFREDVGTSIENLKACGCLDVLR